MAKQISLVRGGLPTPVFPNGDGSNISDPTKMAKIAWEYDRGGYTLSIPFEPTLMPWQTSAFNRASTPLEVGDDILMLSIPARHRTNCAFVHVWRGDEALAGCTLRARLIDFDGTTYTPQTTLDSAAVIEPDKEGAYYMPFDWEYVEDGHHLFLALTVVTMPTDTDVAVEDFAGAMGLVLKAEDFWPQGQQ